MKILIISPHPDDEILGCGGTIINHINKGDEVTICFVTKAYTPDWTEEYLIEKEKQIKKSCEIMGVKNLIFLDYPTVKLDTIPQKEINDSLSKTIKKINPEIVYIPHKGDLNKDHRIVFESCLVALRPYSTNVKKIISYEVLSETEWGRDIHPFIPNYYINIKNTIDKKIQAIEEHKLEIKENPHPRSKEGIRNLAKRRGSEVGFEYAEAFLIIREIEN